MASESSFDVVSRVDTQELDNALNQTRKEIENRFDFKHSKTSIESDGKKITLDLRRRAEDAQRRGMFRPRPFGAASTSKPSNTVK